MTYLYQSQKKRSADSFRMVAPVPGIPVSRLDWTVFYPESWNVKKVDGSFIAAQKHIFGRYYLNLNKKERKSLYSMLQQTNASQQTSATEGKNVLAFMPGSPKNLYGYMILVTNEQPWVEIRFGSASIDRVVMATGVFAVLVLGLFVGRYFKRKKRMEQKNAIS